MYVPTFQVRKEHKGKNDMQFLVKVKSTSSGPGAHGSLVGRHVTNEENHCKLKKLLRDQTSNSMPETNQPTNKKTKNRRNNSRVNFTQLHKCDFNATENFFKK